MQNNMGSHGTKKRHICTDELIYSKSKFKGKQFDSTKNMTSFLRSLEKLTVCNNL